MSLYIDHVISEGLLDHKSHRTQTLVTATTSGTLALDVNSEAVHVFTGTTAGQIVTLPSATTLTIGYRYQLNNDSTQNVTVKDFDGTTLMLLASDTRGFFTLVDASATAGVWSFFAVRKLPQSPEQFLATYSGSGLSVSYTGGNANFDGSFSQINSGSIALPASTTDGWLYVDIDGVVKATSTIPDNALTLYKFTTSEDTVTHLEDFRDVYDQNLVWGIDANISSVTNSGTASGGVLERYARADHVHGSTLPLYKSGVVASGSFEGNPKTYAVTFATAFGDANYSVSVIGGDGRSWIITNQAAGGFTISSQANQALTASVSWIAVAHGASL